MGVAAAWLLTKSGSSHSGCYIYMIKLVIVLNFFGCMEIARGRGGLKIKKRGGLGQRGAGSDGRGAPLPPLGAACAPLEEG
jgi:hypothetical protein